MQECIKEDFASIVGACIYMSITCRPDIVTLCNKACKGMHDPKFGHILYLEYLLKYLKGTREDGLVYKAEGSTISNTRDELRSKYARRTPLPDWHILSRSHSQSGSSAYSIAH